MTLKSASVCFNALLHCYSSLDNLVNLLLCSDFSSFCLKRHHLLIFLMSNYSNLFWNQVCLHLKLNALSELIQLINVIFKCNAKCAIIIYGLIRNFNLSMFIFI